MAIKVAAAVTIKSFIFRSFQVLERAAAYSLWGEAGRSGGPFDTIIFKGETGLLQSNSVHRAVLNRDAARWNRNN